MGSDLLDAINNAGTIIFQSTLPAWGATPGLLLYLGVTQFQSTLPAWGATIVQERHERIEDISIHAPRVGSDTRCDRE